jgi:uncharacterized membrane protein
MNNYFLVASLIGIIMAAIAEYKTRKKIIYTLLLSIVMLSVLFSLYFSYFNESNILSIVIASTNIILGLVYLILILIDKKKNNLNRKK